MNKMIVYIAGGLGNQMFEYAFTRALQLNFGVKIENDLCELAYHSYEGRNYSLNYLNISQDCTQTKVKWLRYILFKAYKKYLSKRANDMSIDEKYIFFNQHGMLVSHESYKFYNFIVNNKTKYVYGNFQSWKYFSNYEDIIKHELRVKEKASKENQRLIGKLRNCNSVCVHIRRGDYISKPEWNSLNVCTYKYYLDGMKYIQKIHTDAVFYIFSNTPDDVQWIRDNYNFSFFRVEYIEMNNPDYEELRLMYSCKHFIISNSTFSWWGQYLAESKNKIVVAPSIWNRFEDTSDLYQDNWVIIEV